MSENYLTGKPVEIASTAPMTPEDFAILIVNKTISANNGMAFDLGEAKKIITQYTAAIRQAAISELLEQMTDKERMEAFYDYCSECGRKQPNSFPRCQCWNDE